MTFPPEPEGLSRIVQWDTSPLRPWEWWEQDAEEWTEAVAVKAAFNAGMAEYRDEKARNEALAKKDAERQAAVLKGG